MDIRSAPDRRQPLHPDITEAMIEKLVRSFYDRVRAHEALGPIFEAAIGDEWEPHLHKMFDFWSSVTLMTGRFKGKPMQAHMKLPEIEPQHFEDWLSLFRQTARQVCPPGPAAIFIDRAETIAESLKLGLFYWSGRAMPGPEATR